MYLPVRQAAEQPLIVLRTPALAPKRSAGASVERLDAVHTQRSPSVLWLAWVGNEPPPLAVWWRDYLRRFAVDHWHRFAKQDLSWTLPQVGTPERAQCWSDLMPLLIHRLSFRPWQLWLARNCVHDVRLPWQQPRLSGQMTPGRVRQGMASLLAAIGSPAPEPKPRGKAPGWRPGRVRKRRERYAVVKKGRKKPRTTA